MSVYQGLILRGEVYVGNRPLLSKEAKMYLGMKVLDPFHPRILKEFGSVWWFYETDLSLSTLGAERDVSKIARYLGIRGQGVGRARLSPSRKFEIYTCALFLCFSNGQDIKS